jgi:hypothetical protein
MLTSGSMLAACSVCLCLILRMESPIAYLNCELQLTNLEMFAVIFTEIFILVITYEARTISCAENANIWIYCVWCLIVGRVIASLSSLAKQISVWIFLVQTGACAFMAVWGTLMWSVMDETCFIQHNADFWSLILLFTIYVVLMYAGIGLSFFHAAFHIADASGSLRTDHSDGIAWAVVPPGAPAQGDALTETTPLVSKGTEHV